MTWPLNLAITLHFALSTPGAPIIGTALITATQLLPVYYEGDAASWLDPMAISHIALIHAVLQFDPTSCNYEAHFFVDGDDPSPFSWFAHLFTIGIYDHGSPVNFTSEPLTTISYPGGGSFDI